MVQTFLLFDTITNEKTVKFMQCDIILSTITWHLRLVGSNNFGEYTSFSPFTLLEMCISKVANSAVTPVNSNIAFSSSTGASNKLSLIIPADS